jgi:hypothetical protein
MAYVLYTPPLHNDRNNLPTARRPERAIGRIWGPMRTGYTQYRIDNVWHQKAVPTTVESLACDVDTDGQILFLRGGHWHHVREQIVTEIEEADGLTVGDYTPV